MLVATYPIGERVRQLREAAGMSQYQLAKLAGVLGSSLSRIEKGERDPSWTTVVKLARALGAPLTEFDLDPPDDPPPPTQSRGKKK